MIAKHVIMFCLMGAVLTFPASSAQAQVLQAGVARVDITPPLGLALQGYSNPERIATRVRDPLYARVLVLQTGAERLALVDLDLIAPFGPTYLAQLREKARTDVAGNLIVAAIHTHSGPSLIPTVAGAPEHWEAAAVEKIEGAIHNASAHMVMARLGVGYGVAYLGHNRLRRERDGSVIWFERNWTKIPTAPVDPTVTVVRIDDASGTPIAVLINYACHPVIFGPDSRLYSADFPAVTVETFEKAFAGKPMCFFLQGGDGDINPYYAVTPLERDAVDLRHATGAELGIVAAQVAQQIQTTTDADSSLQFAEEYLTFGPRWMRSIGKRRIQSMWNQSRSKRSPNMSCQSRLH